MGASNLIGILIVTHNAHDKLELIIDGLTDRYFEIVVADSSDEKWGASKNYSINYYHCPHLDLVEKLRIYSEKVTSEFVLVHPDGEILNLYALDFLNAQLQASTEFISSTLSQNLTLIKQGNDIIVRPRNYLRFVEYATYCIGAEPELEECLTPYHQMIWGLHRTSLFRRIIAPLSNIEWGESNCQNLTLFERVFNVFMHKEGRVIVSTLPLFLRNAENSVDRTGLNLQSIDTWHANYMHGSKTHCNFFTTLCGELAASFNLNPSEMNLLLLRMFKSEVGWLDKHVKPTFSRRFICKFLHLFSAINQEKYIYMNKKLNGIRVEVDEGQMTSSEFHVFISGLHPFLLTNYNAIKTFNK